MLSKGKKFLLIGIYLVGLYILPALIVVPIVAVILGYALQDVGGSFYVLSLMNFVTYAILCSVLLALTWRTFKQDFKKIESWGNFCAQMGIGLACTFGAVLIGNTIVMLFGTTDVAANQQLIESTLAAMPVFMIITIIFLGPVVEEIIFRLVMVNLFNWKPVFGLIFSSLTFGLVHVLIGGWIHIIPYALIGFVLGFFYLKNDNIWHVTVLHILHNAITVGLMFALQHLAQLYYGL